MWYSGQEDAYRPPRCTCGARLSAQVAVDLVQASVRDGGKLGMVRVNPNSRHYIVRHLFCNDPACGKTFGFKRDFRNRIVRDIELEPPK